MLETPLCGLVRPNSLKKLSPSPLCNLRNFVPEIPQAFILSLPRGFPNLPCFDDIFPVPENWGILGNSPKFPNSMSVVFFFLLLLKKIIFNQSCL